MKKRLLSIFVIVLAFFTIATMLTACSSGKETLPDGVSFKNLVLDGEVAYGKVSNETTIFSFANEVEVRGDAMYKVYRDISCETSIDSKTISLNIGDNKVYLLETIGNEIKLYTIIVRRKPIYTVLFNTNGGAFVQSQQVEEDDFAVEPISSRQGYIFNGWDYNFGNPITKNTTINALWLANTNTTYRVEYYLENLNDSNYTKDNTLTQNLTGVTGKTTNVKPIEIEHFTFNSSKSNVSGTINADGSLVLKLYYTRNVYTLSLNGKYGSITKAGTYKYGTQLSSTVTPYLGCDFAWYSGDKLLSTELTYSFTVTQNVTAKISVKEELNPFKFSFSTTTCKIIDVIDKTITKLTVPDYVTEISEGAFKGCESLQEITLPFVGARKTETQGPLKVFGYIFGYIVTNASVNGTTAQYYNGTYYRYYIPTSIKTVIITNGETINDYSFKNCTSLTSVEIPNSVTSIGDSAFDGCYSLTSVEIPNSVTSIGDNAFSWCSSLTSIEIPNSVTRIGSEAFYSCDSFTSIEIPNSVTSIGDYAFSGCSNLQYNVKGGIKYLGNNDNKYLYLADVESNSITTATIDSKCRFIGTFAFENCYSLTSVVLSGSVETIGAYAFSYCRALTSIKYRGNSLLWKLIDKGSNWDKGTGNYTITYNYVGE